MSGRDTPISTRSERAGVEAVELPDGFPLEREAPIAPARIGYEWTGPQDGPTVVALGGISADGHMSAHAADGRDGWWEVMVGPGRPLDTDRIRVVGMDWVGGPGRSSGPARQGGSHGPHDEPADGAVGSSTAALTSSDRHEPGAARARIPVVTTADQARALAAALDHLGVDRVHAVIGASYGAMVALSFASLFPDRLSRVVAISGAHESHPMATALRSLQRRIALLGRDAGDPRRGLVLARSLAMTTYRSVEDFRTRFGMDPELVDGDLRFPVEDYLNHQGETFAARFDLDHFLCLCQSLDLHRVDPARIHVPTTLLAVEEDSLVPLWQMQALRRGLGGPAELVEIRSISGHDAFLVERETVGQVLRAVVDDTGGAASSEAGGVQADADAVPEEAAGEERGEARKTQEAQEPGKTGAMALDIDRKRGR